MTSLHLLCNNHNGFNTLMMYQLLNTLFRLTSFEKKTEENEKKIADPEFDILKCIDFQVNKKICYIYDYGRRRFIRKTESVALKTIFISLLIINDSIERSFCFIQFCVQFFLFPFIFRLTKVFKSKIWMQITHFYYTIVKKSRI